MRIDSSWVGLRPPFKYLAIASATGVIETAIKAMTAPADTNTAVVVLKNI
jgi:hypothetical protein